MNRDILENLVEGIIDEQAPENHGEDGALSAGQDDKEESGRAGHDKRENTFLKFNLQTRALKKKSTKLVRRLTLKNINADSGEADLRSIDKKDQKLAAEYSAMQKEVKKFLHTKVEHHMHFQNAAREDKHQRYNSTQLNKMLNSEFLSRIAGTNASRGLSRELSILTDLRDSDEEYSSESGQVAKAS